MLNSGDKVTASFDGKTIEGIVQVLDPWGGGYCFGVCPSYDIMATDGILYKHIPANEVKAVNSNE